MHIHSAGEMNYLMCSLFWNFVYPQKFCINHCFQALLEIRPIVLCFSRKKMACSNKWCAYKLVDCESALKDALSELKISLKSKRNNLLAVDCEGVRLSRKGALTIITVAIKEKTYIFDVVKLGQAVFREGLGEMLEDESVEKLMFDCREDSDALWHQFSVKLNGVLDLQLLEIIYSREKSTAAQFNFTVLGIRNIEKIKGFAHCLELYVQDEDLMRMKNTGRQLLQHDHKTWQMRPLSDTLLEYCMVDTMGMFKLYDKLKRTYTKQQARLRVASKRYADMLRSRPERLYDEFEKNAFLPLDIIPDDLGFPEFDLADTVCTGCRRLFRRQEFNAMELNKEEQKCRVCKQVTRRADGRWGRLGGPIAVPTFQISDDTK